MYVNHMNISHISPLFEGVIGSLQLHCFHSLPVIFSDKYTQKKNIAHATFVCIATEFIYEHSKKNLD